MSKRKSRTHQITTSAIAGRQRPLFRPGQSGNPTGSRKAIPTIGVRLRDLMYSKVTVTEQGRSRRISRLDVMLRQLGNDAMRGVQTRVQAAYGIPPPL